MHKKLFISATGTDVGKTFFSNLILKKLLKTGKDAAYYKPIQCGFPTDIELIKSSHPHAATYNSYTLKTPCSPDYAALLESIEISTEKILADYKKFSEKHEYLIVEGAGGLAVPYSKSELISDLVSKLELPLILVISPRLGTINHSLLSIEHARSKNINILGLLVAYFDQISDIEKAAIESISRISGLGIINLEDLFDL